MKKLITTASVAALSVVGLQAAHDTGLHPIDPGKPWSVSASLRGFYDDNYTTSPKENERDSFGLSITPSVTVHVARERTHFNAGYVYDLKWYEDRSAHEIDHSHQFNAKLDHAFSEMHKIDLSESFAISKEPAIIEPPGPQATFLRTDGDAIRNLASINYTGQFTPRLGMLLGYSNAFYDYDEEGNGRRSAILDRMEHLATLNFRWNIQPTTIGVLGYQFGVTDYTEDNDSLDGATGNFFFDPLTGGFGVVPYVDPSIRDNVSHYFYVGVDHSFNYKLNGSIRAGAQFTDFRNAEDLDVSGIASGLDDSDVTPYVDASLTWVYNPGSYLQAGVRHSRNTTDVAFFGGAVPTLDQQSTTFYAAVNHRITPKLNGRLLGQYQSSEFQGGTADGLNDNYFTAGLNFNYQFNPWLGAEAGYNYDRLSSDLGGRSFTRNRVYIGLRATY